MHVTYLNQGHLGFQLPSYFCLGPWHFISGPGDGNLGKLRLMFYLQKIRMFCFVFVCWPEHDMAAWPQPVGRSCSITVALGAGRCYCRCCCCSCCWVCGSVQQAPGVVALKSLLKVPFPPSPSIDSNSRPGLIGLQGQGPCRVL